MTTFALAFADARTHAREVFPEESCGLIVSGRYIRCENVAADPKDHIEDPNCGCRLCSFEIDARLYLKHADKIDVVVHSHPNGPFFPSKADMEGQALTGKPWAIIALDDERVSDRPVMWGGKIPPLLGREFMHGVTDCYAVIRDAYALGREELARQGIPDWPFEPIKLPDFPRTDAWWEQGENLYVDNFARAGFEEVQDGPQPGDVFLVKIRSQSENHGGLFVGNDLIVHHLPSRMSRREPAGLWARQASRWLRFKGLPDA